MKQNINIEAEGLELILKNKAGDYVIIPKKYRAEVQGMIKDGCHSCIDKVVETLPVMNDYAEDGSLLPDWNKIKTTLNPKNWGVLDYSDKGDFNTAFTAARKAGEKEFMWNNTRYTTNKDTDPIIKNPKNEKEVALNNYYKKYYPEFVKNYNSNRPNVNVDPEINRAFYNRGTKTLNVRNYDDESGDFIAELAHHKQKNGINNIIKSRYEYLRYGDDKRYDKEGTVEYNTHRLTEPALYMQRDGNLSKEDILKLQKYLKVKEDGILGQETYKAVVDKYYNPRKSNEKYPDSYDNSMSRYYLRQIAKDPNINLKGLVNNKKYFGEDDNWEGAYFDDNQLLKLNPNNKNFDTLALQRELRNRGYKLPKSTKENGDFDGIWGDETKNALLDYQIKNKPVMNNYAEGGPLITKDKKKITLEHRPYTAVQSSTYVAPKGTIPLELKGKQQFNPREQPVLRADTRTELERKKDQEYTESVVNPSISTQIGEALQLPLRWIANPIKGVGDIVSFVAPNSALAKDLPNTDEDIFEHRKKQLNPYTSNKEKINNTINEASNLGINSLINASTMELGFALPRSFVSPAMTNMFREGSKAGFAADFLQLLTKTDFDKISDGDMNEIANLILTNGSLFSKMYNFDASTVYHNIKNWKNISKSDKIDTYKDIFNISQSINQQTQRESINNKHKENEN